MRQVTLSRSDPISVLTVSSRELATQCYLSRRGRRSVTDNPCPYERTSEFLEFNLLIPSLELPTFTSQKSILDVE